VHLKLLGMMIQKLREFVEIQAFGVCTNIGEKLGIATSKIRTWFIYISFLTMGSPIIIYMILAFWMNMKNYIMYGKRNPIKY
jgi:phage shock protein PspC (stress-responsive transcriptional regulator)